MSETVVKANTYLVFVALSWKENTSKNHSLIKP